VKKIILGVIFYSVMGNCIAQQKVVKTQSDVNVIQDDGNFLKRKVAIARFTNETQYAKGLFYNKANDPIAKQAFDILSTKLTSSGKFLLLERGDIEKIKDEYKVTGDSSTNQKIGADYIILGSVTEFGRKELGQSKVFSTSKTQTVQAGVSLRLVEVSTGLVIYSEEGKGEASAVAKTTMGLGATADYDQTLADKAISVAISKLVENIIQNCSNKPWKSYFLAYDEGAIIVSGGKSQGLKVGNTFVVFEKGRSIKNPQTGIIIELPGKIVGKVKIDSMAGETAESEYSMVSFIEGTINKDKLDNYIIKENK
jgi:curli biogenesis system outer membrane secretion channel CsgG